ncbi:MAG: hypothetical protein E6618_12815 [Staphylococcus warneri]|nr:hypothetical protein [Staphylococcus warneri]
MTITSFIIGLLIIISCCVILSLILNMLPSSTACETRRKYHKHRRLLKQKD